MPYHLKILHQALFFAGFLFGAGFVWWAQDFLSLAQFFVGVLFETGLAA
jgi:hypothetical protein